MERLVNEKNMELGMLVNYVIEERKYFAEYSLSLLIKIYDTEKDDNNLFDCGKEFPTSNHNMTGYGANPDCSISDCWGLVECEFDDVLSFM